MRSFIFLRMQRKMNKDALRLSFKEKRKALSEEEREALSIKIANKALRLPIWDEAFYHIYLPIKPQAEVNTEHILSILSGKDKNIVVAATEANSRELNHILLTDNTLLKMNRWGIPEPQGGLPVAVDSLDIVFVPLLAFDKMGNRLGYGKGYYDTFLKQCRPDCLKIGLSFFEPLQHLPVEKHDVPLNACITVDNIYRF